MQARITPRIRQLEALMAVIGNGSMTAAAAMGVSIVDAAARPSRYFFMVSSLAPGSVRVTSN